MAIERNMKIAAKSLILDLLRAGDGRPFAAGELVAAGKLFRISGNSIRVTLARLSAEGLVGSVERGSYRLGPAAAKLAGEVSAWRTAESRLRNWTGGYLAVNSAAGGRGDRAALRRRERALHMSGFRELDRGFYVRPDNIEKDTAAVRQRLHNLGLERDCPVFVAGDFDATREQRARALWDGAKLNALYRTQREALETWLARSDRLEPVAAARESFLLGGRAIHAVVFDPLLPEPLVDTKLRRGFFRTVLEFDRAGHGIWRRLIRTVTADATAAPLEAAVPA